MMNDTVFKEDIKLDEKIKKETELPRRYKVIVMNDDQPYGVGDKYSTTIFTHQAEQLINRHMKGPLQAYIVMRLRTEPRSNYVKSTTWILAMKLEVE